MPLRPLDGGGPGVVRVDGIDRTADRLHAPLVELRLEPGHVAELSRADRREVTRVREENGPAVADPVVKADRPSVVTAAKSGPGCPHLRRIGFLMLRAAPGRCGPRNPGRGRSPGP